MLRRLLPLLLAVACFSAQGKEEKFPRVADAYLVKRDGKVLWQAGANAHMAPASLTKMMTALVVLESGRLDETVTVSRAASKERGSRIGLRAGDQLLARDLVAAMVVHSANDACRALADHIGVTMMAKMNERVRSLGLRDTNFEDPCGWDRPNHYSTASDLARIAEQVMQNQDYARLARSRSLTIATLDRKKRFSFNNTNALIGRYEGAIGVKTGTTGGAGQCLVAIAERGGVRVTLVMLKARNRWWSAAGLLDRAFAAEL